MSEKILLIDDDKFLAQSLTRLLESQGYEVASAHGVVQGRELAGQQVPDLIILDLGLPDGDGVELCRDLRTVLTSPILMLTSRGESIDKVIGFDAGADDYLVKPFDPHELLARVRALLRRQNQYDRPSDAATESVLEVGDLRIDPTARIASVGPNRLTLTNTEFDLLKELATNVGRAIHRDALFTSVWGFSPDFSSNSLDVLTHRLRTKLRAAGAGDLIQTVRGFGFRMGPPETT